MHSLSGSGAAPDAAPFYVNPARARSDANLVASLMGNPATAKQRPLERQATIVLAWLLDHSRRFADEVLRRWFPDVVEITGQPTAVGARAWDHFARCLRRATSIRISRLREVIDRSRSSSR